ncbi:MAG: site-2 protease family protein [Candidatus Promineifilaceae bacterium]|nr:site-2 protease family protein [Candidatus Promineifilaceae bacterium]
MGSSLKLFTIRDIDIKLHITFPLILVWAGLQFGLLAGSLATAFFGVVAVTLLFVLVTLHELGHSFAAQHYGVPVKQIVLTPLGGVAQLNEMPEDPLQELVIASAGPAVNVVAALLMGGVILFGGIELGNPLAVLTGAAGFSLSTLFVYVFIYNIVLAVFNLLPAFPMDGGRILRALLALRLEYSRATSIAATIGRGFAVLMGLYGLFNGGIFLILIAAFIFFGAGQEAGMVRMRNKLRGVRVSQVYQQRIHTLTLDSTVQQAANLMLYTGQRNFPVVDEGDELVGFLSSETLEHALRNSVPHAPIARFMRADIVPVSRDDDLFDVQKRMATEALSAIPVAEGGRLVGLVTERSLGELLRLLDIAPNAMLRGQSAYGR